MTQKLKKSNAVLAVATVILFIGALSFVLHKTLSVSAEDNEISGKVIEPEINEGTFYLNGDVKNCYFTLKDGKIQLNTQDSEKLLEYYNEQAMANEKFSEVFEFDNWYNQICEDWAEPYQYIVHTYADLNQTYILWNYYCDEFGNIGGLCVEYVDEDNFKADDCLFTRVSEE